MSMAENAPVVVSADGGGGVPSSEGTEASQDLQRRIVPPYWTNGFRTSGESWLPLENLLSVEFQVLRCWPEPRVHRTS